METGKDRLFLGTPRNHTEPIISGRNRFKYGKSILEKAKIMSNTQN